MFLLNVRVNARVRIRVRARFSEMFLNLEKGMRILWVRDKVRCYS
jgi:hypothetical protein